MPVGWTNLKTLIGSSHERGSRSDWTNCAPAYRTVSRSTICPTPGHKSPIPDHKLSETHSESHKNGQRRHRSSKGAVLSWSLHSMNLNEGPDQGKERLRFND